MSKNIAIEKPEAKVSRFSKAKSFATDTDIKIGIEATPEPTQAKKTASKKQSDVSLKKAKRTNPTKRENWELDIEIGRAMRMFMLSKDNFEDNQKRFPHLCDFLTQCVVDGLEKYGNVKIEQTKDNE